MSLQLKKYDMSKIVDASGNLKTLIGKRDTGISWIQRDIKYNDKKY
jgi:hypothetical protein